jgi:quinol monooxygenase YgiN
MRLTHVTLRVKPDRAELYEKAFHELRAKVLENEPGVFVFEACRDPVEPNTYRVFEGYKTPEAIQKHIVTDYYIASARIFVECIEGDHMAEIERQGLRGVDMYKAVKGLKFERMETI